MQTNKPRFQHAFIMDTHKKKPATSKIEGSETTFVHLAVDTKGCLHL